MFQRLKTFFTKRGKDTPVAKSGGYWPFDQPRNCTTITMRQVLEGKEPILLVSHDEHDHGWQFIGSTDGNTADGRVVCLEEMVRLDPTILEVATLPPGWQATRVGLNYPWKRERHPDNDVNTAVADAAMEPFICPVCHKEHRELPHVGMDRPHDYWDVPEEKRKQDVKLTDDTCEIADIAYFVRGVIEIPVIGYPRGFGFGVWVSHKKESYLKYLENFDSPDIGPFFGWLCTRLDYYNKDTLHLKTMAHYRGGGLRPLIKLEPTDHPLSLDQKNGISLEKAWAIVHFYAKGAGKN